MAVFFLSNLSFATNDSSEQNRQALRQVPMSKLKTLIDAGQANDQSVYEQAYDEILGTPPPSFKEATNPLRGINPENRFRNMGREYAKFFIEAYTSAINPGDIATEAQRFFVDITPQIRASGVTDSKEINSIKRAYDQFSMKFLKEQHRKLQETEKAQQSKIRLTKAKLRRLAKEKKQLQKQEARQGELEYVAHEDDDAALAFINGEDDKPKETHSKKKKKKKKKKNLGDLCF